MTKRILFAFAVLTLAVASAKTFTVKLLQDSVLAGTELKAGDYRLELNDSKIVIKNGRQTVDAPVRVEENTTKFRSTTVRYAAAEGTPRIQEIRLGGTNLRLLVD
ncbi:MAG: hypothetical protein ACM3S5_02160 [Rhodospirillales bacterium]